MRPYHHFPCSPIHWQWPQCLSFLSQDPPLPFTFHSMGASHWNSRCSHGSSLIARIHRCRIASSCAPKEGTPVKKHEVTTCTIHASALSGNSMTQSGCHLMVERSRFSQVPAVALNLDFRISVNALDFRPSSLDHIWSHWCNKYHTLRLCTSAKISLEATSAFSWSPKQPPSCWDRKWNCPRAWFVAWKTETEETEVRQKWTDFQAEFELSWEVEKSESCFMCASKC